MLAEERLDLILRQLAADGRVMAGDLAARFAVSEDTVRRDLRELAKAGYCRKVYGGAGPAPRVGPIGVRAQMAPDAKARLAVAAVRRSRPIRRSSLMQGRPTSPSRARFPRIRELTVLTNAPSVAEAAGSPIDQDRHAGRDRRSGHRCLPGWGDPARDQPNPRRSLLSWLLRGRRIDWDHRIRSGEAEIKRAMSEHSLSLVVVATTDKLATAAPFRVTKPDAITHLVVEFGAPPPILASFAEQGSQVHVAD